MVPGRSGGRGGGEGVGCEDGGGGSRGTLQLSCRRRYFHTGIWVALVGGLSCCRRRYRRHNRGRRCGASRGRRDGRGSAAGTVPRQQPGKPSDIASSVGLWQQVREIRNKRSVKAGLSLVGVKNPRNVEILARKDVI